MSGSVESEVTPPLVEAYTLDGGYAGCTISKAGDPDAPNMSGVVKTRLLIAMTPELLAPQITACLISDFGLTQEEAEALVPTAAPTRQEHARQEHASPQPTPPQPSPEQVREAARSAVHAATAPAAQPTTKSSAMPHPGTRPSPGMKA
jgi:hypothetical protein